MASEDITKDPLTEIFATSKNFCHHLGICTGQEDDYVTSWPRIFRKNMQNAFSGGAHLDRGECFITV